MGAVFIAIISAVGGVIAGIMIERRMASRRQRLPFDTSNLKVVEVESITAEQAYDRYYAGSTQFDQGHLAFVWHLPKSYPRIATNGPLTMVQKDSNGQFWVYAYGYEKYLDPSEPYREYTGYPMLKGFCVVPTELLERLSLVVYEA
jgi:hypothetical protein